MPFVMTKKKDFYNKLHLAKKKSEKGFDEKVFPFEFKVICMLYLLLDVNQNEILWCALV